MPIYWPGKRLLILFLAVWLVAFSFSSGGNYGGGEKLAAKEKQVNYSAKPGKVIYIGIIPPEILEEPLARQKELPQEKEKEQPLRPEEIARLRQRLKELEKEKQTLTGDFYGINQYGYRYAMVFDRLGYIRFRLHQVETEMAEIRRKLASDF